MMAARPNVESSRALKCDLAVETLGSSGVLRLRAAGRSMLPVVRPGDTLVIERAGVGGVSEGDIVLFRRAHQFFAHRVVRRDVVRTDDDGDSTIVTQGDALPQPDPPLPASELLGKVSFIVRDGRLMAAQKKLSFPQRAVAGVMRSRIGVQVTAGVWGMLRLSPRPNSADPASDHNSQDRDIVCQ